MGGNPQPDTWYSFRIDRRWGTQPSEKTWDLWYNGSVRRSVTYTNVFSEGMPRAVSERWGTGEARCYVKNALYKNANGNFYAWNGILYWDQDNLYHPHTVSTNPTTFYMHSH